MFYDLRPYQLLGVNRIVNEQRTILADDMGMGKTAEAIAAKHLIDEKIGENSTLVVCPGAVAPHWHKQIQSWFYKGSETKVAPLRVTHFSKDLERALGADFVLTSYSLLSHLGVDEQRLSAMQQLGFGYAILDEGHNARNPKSLRTSAARHLLHSIPYLTIPTGTPIPNTVMDIYSLLNLLEPKAFPINDQADEESLLYEFYTILRKTPHLIRDILHTRMIRRTAERYLNKKLPSLEQRMIDVPLTGDHEAVYLELYQNDDIPPAQKLTELVKASLDPNLVNPRFLSAELRERVGHMESCTLGMLENLVQEAIEKDGGKVLGFTDLKKKVIPALLTRLARYNPLAITGDVDNESTLDQMSDREELRRRFQQDPKYRALLTTSVMDEGVDLTAATHMFNLTIPYMPATLDQRHRRSQRASAEVEKDKVVSTTFKPVLSNGAPTITEGILQLLDDKRRIINYILESPENLTFDDLKQIQNGNPQDSPTLSGFLSEKSYMNWHLGSLKGMGGARILAQYTDRPYIAQNLARAYARNWEGFYGGNTATLTARIIRNMVDVDNAKILDIASGPFSLSRRLQVPVTNLDLNRYMLEAGKLLESEGVVPRGNKSKEGLANALPFRDREFNLANCSLALHMTSLNAKNKEGQCEREQILREANRVLPVGGYYLFALPHSVIHRQDLPEFSQGLGELGFDVLPQTGFYCGPQNTNFKVFLGALQKRDEPRDDPLPEEQLTWRMDLKLNGKRTGRTTQLRRSTLPKKKVDKFELITEFYQVDNGKLVSEEETHG